MKMEMQEQIEETRNIEEAKNTKGHLERILMVAGDMINSKDKKFLNEKIGQIKDDIRNCNPFRKFLSLYEKSIIKKIIKQAKSFREGGKEYIVNGKEFDNAGLKKLAEEILNNAGSYMELKQIRFLGGSIINSLLSESFSAKQILYIESLENFANNVVAPHKSGKEFNKRVYEGFLGNRLLNFAINGKFKISSPEKNCLEVIRKKWYDKSTGLDSLRKNIVEALEKRKLSIKPEAYGLVITDLERYFKRN